MTAYHEGERAVQERTGVREMADRVGGSIHDRIPARAADFLRTAPLLVAGLLDARGRPWASPVAGLPGVVTVTDESSLTLAQDPATLLPGPDAPRPGDAIGLLALEPSTRRRARVNGRVLEVGERRLRIAVEQVYANCPKYIQKREVVAVRDGTRSDTVHRARGGTTLSERQSERIRCADTFFIASVHAAGGADASHRGGLPGFVAAGETWVSWPDYPGNRMFNTLGNLVAYPRAGLLFLDFHGGGALRVTGSASVDWSGPRDADPDSVGRRVTLAIDEVVETERELPIAFRFEEYSPHNPSPR